MRRSSALAGGSSPEIGPAVLALVALARWGSRAAADGFQPARCLSADALRRGASFHRAGCDGRRQGSGASRRVAALRCVMSPHLCPALRFPHARASGAQERGTPRAASAGRRGFSASPRRRRLRSDARTTPQRHDGATPDTLRSAVPTPDSALTSQKHMRKTTCMYT